MQNCLFWFPIFELNYLEATYAFCLSVFGLFLSDIFYVLIHDLTCIRDLVVSHFQDLILVDLLEMQHLDFLDGGWVYVPCFLFAAGTLKPTLLTMHLGPLGKRFCSALVLLL